MTETPPSDVQFENVRIQLNAIGDILDEIRAQLDKLQQGIQEVPETITCEFCDAQADDIKQAISEGWTDICRDDGLSWNFLGLCPSCNEQQNPPPVEPQKVLTTEQLWGQSEAKAHPRTLFPE